MKKLTIILFFVSFSLFAQNSAKASLEQLRYEVKENIKIEPDQNIMQQYKARKKNNGIAIMLSALLPGMGELYAGSYSSGKYFTIADAVLWGGLIGVNAYANNQEDNYRAFAVANGGVNLTGKNDKYFADVGNYMDVYEYNHIMELDRNFSAVYNESTHYWKWDSQSERREYRDMWKASENASNSTRFIVGALILNRIASAINAIRLVNKYNKNLKQELGWEISFDYSNTYSERDKMSMNFRMTF